MPKTTATKVTVDALVNANGKTVGKVDTILVGFKPALTVKQADNVKRFTALTVQKYCSKASRKTPNLFVVEEDKVFKGSYNVFVDVAYLCDMTKKDAQQLCKQLNSAVDKIVEEAEASGLLP